MNFFVPTSVRVGEGCLRAGGADIAALGRHCLVVTGRSSARLSGALADLSAVLNAEGIAFTVYDGIEQNPSYASCLAAAKLARTVGAEFVIGVGGGSPLDAAKAIAALATISDTSPRSLYSAEWDAAPLPIVAIGTTAGTGSEVTPVAVITAPDGVKRSFRAPSLYPRLAFGDATYMMSLSPEFTRSTALDALAHCLESYFNRTANDISRTLAARGIGILAKLLARTAVCGDAPLSFAEREAIYCASLYGGYAISVTGTAFPHALGYFLSERYGIPHGNACAVYLEAFIRHNCAVAEEDAALLFSAVGIDADGLIALVRNNLPEVTVPLTEATLAELLPRFEDNKSLKKSYGNVDRAFAEALLRRMFIK